MVNKLKLEAACEGLAFPFSATWIAFSLLQPSTLMASLWSPPGVPKFALPLLQSRLSGTDTSPTLLSCDAAPLSALTQDLYVLNVCDVLLSPLIQYPKSAFLRLRIFYLIAPLSGLSFPERGT